MELSSIENKAIKYVLAIHKYGSITQAANDLFITQSALSKFLINLENQLGFQLFNRFGHRLVPTYEGERFLYYAREMDVLDKQLSVEIHDINNQIGGHLRCAVPIFRASCILPHIIPEFVLQHPTIELSIIEEHCRDLEQLLLDYQADIAITTHDVESPNLVQHIIRQNQIYLAVPLSHPSVKKYKGAANDLISVDIAEFKDETFILQYPGQQMRSTADIIFSEAGISPKVSLTTRSVPSAMELTAQGCGICFLADIYKDFKTHMPLQLFQLKNKHPISNISLIYRRNIYKAQYFLDFIDTVLRNL